MHRSRRTVTATVAVVLVVLAGCGSDIQTRSQPAAETEASPGESASIGAANPDDAVGAAAAARMFDDNSFGGADVFERVNIVDNFGNDSDGFVVANPKSPIDRPARTVIEAALAPVVVTWISNASDVIVAEDSDYTEVGAVLSIAVPVIDGDTAQITTNLWCGGLCGIGGTHELQRDDDGWSVVGVVGPQWIS